MSISDRLGIKVALWPVVTFVTALLVVMALRVASGVGPLPAGAAPYVLSASILITFGALVAANLTRIRTAR